MINKNANGSNKLERQLNKAKKYLNIELVDYSNTYWKIDKFDAGDTFILFTNFRVVKNGELVILEPLNRIKEYFKKSFTVLMDERPYYYNAFVIFKSYGDDQHRELMELVSGYDDVYLLSDWIEKNKKTPGKMLIKKATSGYLDKNGKLHKTFIQRIKSNGDLVLELNEMLEELE